MRGSTILGGGCAALALCAGQAMGAFVLTSMPIALSGASYQNTAQGPNQAGAFFSNLTSPNPSIAGGMVIFRADTNLVSSVNGGSGGLWVWNQGNLGVNNKVVQIGDAAPTTGSYTTSGFNNPILNASGQFAFRDSTSTSGALYSNPGTMGRLLGIGDSAPVIGATTNPTFSGFGTSMNLNSSGAAATTATITGGVPAVISTTGVTQNNTGIWAGTPGSLSLLVRQADPTGVANVLVGSLGNIGTGFTFNNNGKLLFSNTLQGSAIVTTGNSNQLALLSTRNGSIEIVARRGDAFPDANGVLVGGVPAGEAAVYNAPGTGAAGSCMNDQGRLVFTSTLRTASTGTPANGTPTSGGSAALFSDHQDGTLRTVARHTQPIPASTGLTGLNWGSTFSNPVINGSNTIAFSNGGMTGTDPLTNLPVTSSANGGVFKVNSAGVMSTVYRMGDAAPAYSGASGNPALNQNTGTVLFSGTPSNIAMNSSGQMAFVAGLGGTGIVQGAIGNNSALFAVDWNGDIFLVAQKHMLFQVAPGDMRIVSSSGIGSVIGSGGQDGRGASLDDNGNLVFWLQFTDVIVDPSLGGGGDVVTSSGVFVFHIPAPGSAGLLAIGGLVAARRRRR